MKERICAAVGIIGAWVVGQFGGWNNAMTTLLLFMAADYITGLIVAGVFKCSPKTETGALQSKAGLIGLLKKSMILLALLIACRLDLLLSTTFIRDSVCISFIINELISIIENLGLMGVPVPDQLVDAIDILKNKIHSQSENFTAEVKENKEDEIRKDE